MSKKAFKSQASSGRAFSASSNIAFGSTSFGRGPGSALSYVYEPPDLGGISDPSVIVSFKNLQKKDGTTKAKALEDLQAYIASLGEDKSALKDAFLDAWVKLFPRISIDNARRVRQLAYSLQAQLATLCGKRFGKYMPATVGAWLAGTYDGDRPVARSAQESFAKTFPSEDKQIGVWKAFQTQILDYCTDIVSKETPQTLSDERTASPDDAESKYSRAVGGALLTISGALVFLSGSEAQKDSDTFSKCLQSDTVWGFASSKDAFLRKAVYRLLPPALDKLGDVVQLQDVGKAMVKALDADQIGSMKDFLSSLEYLTRKEPNIWTSLYTGSAKKPPGRRLSHFLRKGTHGGNTDIWRQLSRLLDQVPESVFTPETSAVDNAQPQLSYPALDSLRQGINRKTEIRTQQSDAWQCYLQLTTRIGNSLIESVTKNEFAKSLILPLLSQYIRPLPEFLEWGSSTSSQSKIVENAVLLAIKLSELSVADEIKRLSAGLIEDLNLSLPEQSKDYTKSQDGLVAAFKRWYGLQASLLAKEPKTADFFEDTTVQEIDAAMAVLKNRNGKPYGAAVVLELNSSIKLGTTASQEGVTKKLLAFASENIPALMGSQSSPYLLRLLNALQARYDMREAFNDSIRNLVATQESQLRTQSLQSLAATEWPNDAVTADLLSKAILEDLEAAMHGSSTSWSLPIAALNNAASPRDLGETILTRMMSGLSTSEEIAPALGGLKAVSGHKNQALQKFVASPAGADLLSKLLFLSHEGDGMLQHQASSLKDALGNLLIGEGQTTAVNPLSNIVRNSLSNISEDALSVESLTSQARDVLKMLSQEQLGNALEELLPSVKDMQHALEPFLFGPINDALTLTNALGGSLYLINSHGQPSTISYPCDPEGRSVPFRMALYISGLIRTTDLAKYLTHDRRLQLYCFLSLFLQFVDDHLALSFKRRAQLFLLDVVKTDIYDVLDDAQKCRSVLIEGNAGKSLVEPALSELYSLAEGTSVSAYYHARAYARAVSELDEPQIALTEFIVNETDFSRMRKSPIIFSDFAKLAGGAQPSVIMKLCNELISDLTGWTPDEDGGSGLQKLIMFNLILQSEDVDLEVVPKQRIIFLVQHTVDVIPAIQDQAIISEIIKVWKTTLPAIKDIYGEFWESILGLIVKALESERSSVPVLYASLVLCRVLSRLAMNDSNEDLQESWVDSKSKIARSLQFMFLRHAEVPDANNQPLRMVNGLLATQLTALSDSIALDTADMFPVMASESTMLQECAFKLLSSAIPTEQERISLDVALNKDFVAKLPEELLSLILEVPTAEDYVDLHSYISLPPSLSRYLLSWKLIFQHWVNASYKLQANYVATLKEGAYVADLLSLIFNVLITSHGSRPTSSFDIFKLPSIETFELDEAEDPAMEVPWLLSHLYILLLKHAPHLAKDWYTNSCPRALKSRVETFTEKHFSPLVAAAELSTVSSWTPPSADDPSVPQLETKIYPRAREVFASIPIDETQMAIRIILPPTYPLAPITIATANRIGVDEKKWTSFLNVSRIVMNFASSSQGLGAVVDGIAAWRNNVLAVMKGQTECAICYSIVSEDRKVPDKRCATCKNLFHGVCLYKWFQRSAASSCPLCRNAFNYA